VHLLCTEFSYIEKRIFQNMPPFCYRREREREKLFRKPSFCSKNAVHTMDMTLTHIEIGFEKGRKRNRKEDKTISKTKG
jgi:hypothetical protein